MDLITTKEAAAMMGVKPSLLAQMRLRNPGWLPFYRFGTKTVRYDRNVVLRKIQSCAVGEAPEDEAQN